MKKTFEVLKKYLGEIVIVPIVCTLIALVIAYIVIGPYNYEFVELLLAIREKGLELYFCWILFPALLIVFFLIKFLEVVIKAIKNKEIE